jgi:chromosome partitioning protein
MYNIRMAKIITIGNHKGGVGKTTTAASLAHGLTMRKKTVLLLDLDAQAQLATLLNIEKEPAASDFIATNRITYDQVMKKTGRANLWLIPGNLETADAAAVLRNKDDDYLAGKLALIDDFDYVIMDTSPGVNDLQRQAIRATDYLIIPTAADFLSAESVYRFLSVVKEVEKKGGSAALAGILPTFYDDTTKESRAVVEELRKEFDSAVLEPVHRATILRECAAHGQTIFEFAPKHRAAKQYNALVDHVMRLA